MSLKYFVGAVCASGGCLVAFFAHMQRNVTNNPAFVGQEMQTKRRKKPAPPKPAPTVTSAIEMKKQRRREGGGSW